MSFGLIGLKLCIGLWGCCVVIVLLALTIGAALPPSAVLAFSSQRDGGDWDLFLLEMQRSILLPLTRDPLFSLRQEFYPTWSPDGESLTFMASRPTDYDLYRLDASGTEHNLTAGSTAQDQYPVWSPDGKWIVYTVFGNDGDNELYLMDAASGQSTPLTDNTFYDGFPTWSPDSTQIVYSSLGFDGHLALYHMDVTHGEASRVNLTPRSNNYAPSWSPDGRFIVFFTDRDGNYELYIMNADGSDPRRLTHYVGDDTFPMWLPDDSGVLFSSMRAGSEDIYVLTMRDGVPVGEPRNLTNHPGADRFAAMQP
jgi:Tol biopolymer transport system component